MANTNRTKGHNAERWYAKAFKNMGFDFVQTARYGSRLHDDAGIDLINLPINVQVKAGKQRNMNPGNVLAYMAGRIIELFPPTAPEHSMINIIIHKKESGKGNKRKNTDEIVHMTFEDFSKMMTMVDWTKK